MKSHLKPVLKATLIITAMCMVLSNPAFALAGLDKGTTLVNDLKTWVVGICAAIGTIMCIFAAFKVWKGDKALDEVTNLLVGGLIVAVGPLAIAALVSSS